MILFLTFTPNYRLLYATMIVCLRNVYQTRIVNTPLADITFHLKGQALTCTRQYHPTSLAGRLEQKASTPAIPNKNHMVDHNPPTLTLHLNSNILHTINGLLLRLLDTLPQINAVGVSIPNNPKGRGAGMPQMVHRLSILLSLHHILKMELRRSKWFHLLTPLPNHHQITHLPSQPWHLL